MDALSVLAVGSVECSKRQNCYREHLLKKGKYNVGIHWRVYGHFIFMVKLKNWKTKFSNYSNVDIVLIP